MEEKKVRNYKGNLVQLKDIKEIPVEGIPCQIINLKTEDIKNEGGYVIYRGYTLPSLIIITKISKGLYNSLTIESINYLKGFYKTNYFLKDNYELKILTGIQ